MELRYYQKEACEAVINKYKTGVKKQALVMATASGKTVCFATLALHFLKESKKKILILAHREELLQQAKNKLLMIDPLLKVEIEQGNNWANTNSDIVIASAPTLGRADSKRIQRFNPNDYQMIIVDEVHRILGSTFINVLKYFRCYKGDKNFDNNDKLLLGVTATPSRSDGQGLDTVFDEIVYSYDIRKGIEDGFLSDIKAYSVTTASDLTGVGTAMGDFVVGELAKAVDNKERNALIVSSYKDIANGSQAIVFAVNVEHAKSLSEYFNNADIKSGCVLGETDNDERREILRKFDKKEIQVLCNVAVCTEGVDIPSIETVMMCRPTKSKIFFSQGIGRGLRLFPGKAHLKLIDFVDNTSRNSLVSLPSLFGLPKGLKSKKEINVMDWVEKAEGLLKERPNYDLESIEDWSDENIQKIIKEVSLFEQAKLPEVVMRASKLAWVEFFDGFSLSIPQKKEIEPVAFLGAESSKLEDSKMKNEKSKMKNEKSEMVISKNMLDHYEVKYKEYVEVDPKFTNKYQKWATKRIDKLGEFKGIEEALMCADGWVYKNRIDIVNILNQDSDWRSSKPTEKQVNLLNKLGVVLPDKITKG
ncbi:MAG: DEAD/DEAH box helicase, partial [Spirochaetes bacterium]|nr:DEAD/DEAH box helicase [Spirochaetota bacterium]